MKKDLKDIFYKVENTLRKETNLSKDDFDNSFSHLKNIDYRKKSDNEIFWIIIYVTFYSGMKAKTVSDKINEIKKIFGDYEKILKYSEKEIDKIKNNKNIIKNKRKIDACFENAKKFKNIVKEYCSFVNYLNSFGNLDDDKNLNRLRNDLMQFNYLGDITVNHFLTDLGLNVIKPDCIFRLN